MMREKSKIACLIFICIIMITNISFAHPGRTDSNGGHYDRSTGGYHYHNGGTSTGLNINDGLIKTDNTDDSKTIIQENNELKDKMNLLEGKIAIYEDDLKEAGFNSISDMKYKLEEKDSQINSIWTTSIILLVIGVIIAYNIGKSRK